MSSFFTKKMKLIGSALIFVISALAVFQNCSPVRFSSYQPEKIGAGGPTTQSCTPPAGRCQANGGSGTYQCTASGLTCVLDSCDDPTDILQNNMCISTAVDVTVDGLKSTSIKPENSTVIQITTNNAPLDGTNSTLNRTAGSCAQTTLSVPELGIPGQTKLQVGQNQFFYNKALAAKIGGCTFEVRARTTTGKLSTASFLALVCDPGAPDLDTPACTTPEGRPGNRFCRADGLGWECRGVPNRNCLFNGQTVAHGAYVTAYSTANVPFGNTCQSEQRQCLDGSLRGTFTYSSCTPLPPSSCTFNGQTVAHGGSVVAYQSSQVAYGHSCNSETRVCTNGILSGSFIRPTCSVDNGLDCHVNGYTVRHGQTETFFAATNVAFGATCSSVSRTCTNGVLSGSTQHIYRTCQVDTPLSCNFNGQNVPHGSSVTAYAATSVPYGQTCSGETRTCNNGHLSGTNQYTNCSVGPRPPNSCVFNGQTIAHGSSITAYLAGSVPFGSLCSSQTRTCNDGTLSGTYGFSACSPTPPRTCIFNNQVIQHGETRTAYLNETEPYGTTCSQEPRVCYDGTMSGSFQYASCTVGPRPPSSCTFNGQIVPHGGTVTGWQNGSVAYNGTCNSETRTCNDGSLSGTYQYPSCTVGPRPPTADGNYFIYASCTKSSGGYACGEGKGVGFYPERVCSGKLISGQADALQTWAQTTPYPHFCSSILKGWVPRTTLKNYVPAGTQCVVLQQVGYNHSTNTKNNPEGPCDQYFNILYYDGLPQPNALNAHGGASGVGGPIIRKATGF